MKKVFSLFLPVLLVLTFISCEIGLGEAVDAQPPVIEITSPVPDAVIRGAFRFGGTWSDDGNISGLTVTLDKTDGTGSYGPFEGTVLESGEDEIPNTWSCIVNPTDGQILDGSYIATVAISDEGEHTTTQTRQFTIDNTPPIIVLQRPSSKSTDESADSYGQTFTLEGQAADDNNVDLIEVQIFAEPECTTLLHVVQLPNVPNAISLDVAKFAEGVENDYSKIYGSTTKNGAKNLYCKVVAYDGAKRYPEDGSNQSPEDLRGNVTSTYYMYEDIATSILSNHKITEVYHMLNGSYLTADTSRSVETVNSVTSLLNSKVVSTGRFSLNPENNPTFIVSGKDQLVKDSNGAVTFTSGNYDITNGSKVVVEVSPGLDGIPLKGDSLSVYIVECDAAGNRIPEAQEIHPTTESSKSGTTYKFIVPIDKADGLVIGRNYIFGVSGTDEKDNYVMKNGNGYGFHFASSGAAPGLTITEPAGSSITLGKSAAGDFSVPLRIAGTTSVEVGAPVVTITDGGNPIWSKTFVEAEASEDPATKKLVYSFDTGNEIFFTGASAYHELDIVSTADAAATTRTKTVTYDCDAPTISIASVSPIVERDDGKKCLNGIVDITFTLNDDFSFIETAAEGKKPYVELWQNGSKVAGPVSFTSTNSNITEKLSINTKQLTDEIPLEIKVFAWDRAGNKAEYSNTSYYISQKTDIPVITPKSKIDFSLKTEDDVKDGTKNSGNNNKIAAGSPVTFTITDDDGIENIWLYRDGTLVATYPETGTANEINVPYSFNLPSDAGYYEYEIKVKDVVTQGAETTYNEKTTEKFTIKATAAAPTITVASEDQDTIKDNWIGAGSTYINTVTVKSTENPFKIYRDNTELSVDGTTVKCESSDSNGAVYKITESPTETTTYSYKVQDANGNDSNVVTVECKVDTVGPTITLDETPGKQDTKASSYTFSGTAHDKDSSGVDTSGIEIIKVTFSNADETNSITKDAKGTANWYYQVNFKDAEWASLFGTNQGEKKITYKAIDKVGISKEDSATFTYDIADPTISVDENTVLEFMTNAGLTINATAKDSYKLGKVTVTQSYLSNPNDENTKEDTSYDVTTSDATKDMNIAVPFTVTGTTATQITPRDGLYRYTIKVEDSVGNTAESKTYEIKYDNTKPTLSLKNPSGKTGKDAIDTTTYKFEGGFVEDNLSGIYYKVLDSTASAPSAPSYGNTAGWEEATVSGKTWNFYEAFKAKHKADGSLDTDSAGLAEGSYKAYLYAIDKANNVSDVLEITFDVDMSNPELTKDISAANITDKTGSVVYFNGNLVVTATAKDTNELPVIDSVVVKLGGSAQSPLGTDSAGQWTISSSKFTENTKTKIEIIAKDIFGKETSAEYTVCLDTLAPAITVDSPAENEKVTNATKNIKGSLRDATSGVNASTAKYKLTRTYNNHSTEETVDMGLLTLTGESWNTDNFKLFKSTESDSTAPEGTFKLYVDAKDNLGTAATQVIRTFFYDKGNPVVSLNPITTPTNSSVTVSGKAYDSNEIVSVVINIDGTERWIKKFAVDGRPQSEPASDNFTATFVVGSTNSLAKFAAEDEENKDKSSYLTDGEHTIKVIATDIAGNTKEEQKTILVDTTAPETLTITPPAGAINEWYNKESLSFTGTVSDDKNGIKTSGIKDVKYSLDNTNWSSALNLGTGTWNGTITGLAQGLNTVYIKATDNAGNEITKNTSVKVDSIAPVAPAVAKVDSVTQYGDTPTQNPLDVDYEKLTNGKAAIAVVLTAKDDETAGTGNFTGLSAEESDYVNESVVITKIGSLKLTTPLKSKKTSDGYEIVIPAYDASTNKYSSGVVQAVITDLAGNKSQEFDLFTIKLDNTYPTVKINTPADADTVTSGIQVNKTIVLTGTVSDDNEIPGRVILEYSSDNGSNWANVTGKDASATVTVNESSWSASLDTTKFTDKSSIKLRAVATDTAGNTGNSGKKTSGTEQYTNEIEVEIDQDTDRPVITINNVNLTASMASNTSVGFSDKRIYGLISDDDGIADDGVEYSVDNGTSWTPVTHSNGSFSIDLSDGSQTVLFKIEDKGGQTFTSSTDTDYSLTPKLTDANENKYGYKNDTTESVTALYLTIDTQNPSVDSVRFKYTKTGAPDWNTSIASQSFGGDSDHAKFKLEQKAGDVNGIKKMTVEIPFVTGDTGAAGDAYHKFEVTTGTPEATPRIDGLTYSSYETAEIDASKFVSGSRQATVTIDDGIRQTTTKITLTFDNTAPTISVESHIPEEQIRSSFLLKGNINDGDIGTKVEVLPTASGATPNWSSELVKTLSATTAMTWRAWFDGDTSESDEYTHFDNPKDLFVKLYGTSKGIEKNSDGAIVLSSDHTTKYKTIEKFEFHFRVTDSLGNTNTTDKFVLKVDPQGDIPVITQVSPSATETTQSGTIRFSGSAEDDKSIKGLYLEIDPKYNGTTFTPWSSTHKSPNEKDATDVYTTKAHTAADIKAGDYVTNFTETNVDAEKKNGLYIGNGLSWNIAVNKAGELNGKYNAETHETPNNKVAVRFYAIDVDGNISDPTEPFIFDVDSDAPKIGSSEPFYLYQYNEDNSVKAAVEYTDGMWLKGEWYLVGSVEDESDIKTLTMKDKDNTNVTGNNTHITTWNENKTKGYRTKYPVGNATSGEAGILTYTLEATDYDDKPSNRTFTIKYDNKAPVLSGSTGEFYKIDKTVQNRDGVYTIKSSVEEGDSGFERVVFYFKRTTTGYHYIYDSYLPKNNTNNKLAYDTSMAGVSQAVTSDSSGLWWVESSIVSNGINGDTVTISAANANAHTGGIARIGETIYRVKSVSGTTIILEGKPSSDFDKIYFAIGHVVDHQGAESAGTKANKENGYYTDSPDDDGDRMIESVSTTGNRTIWSGSINSQNIPDGEIELHYVAFDAAGNTAHGVVTGNSTTTADVTDYVAGKPVSIANNAPRLAGVRIWTDYNGNGSEDDGESETMFYRAKTYKISGKSIQKAREVVDTLIVSGNGNDFDDTAHPGTKYMTIRDTTKFYPELVGGNNALYYGYKIGTVDSFKNKSGYTITGYEAAPTGNNPTLLGNGRDDGQDYMQYDEEDSEYVDSHETTNGIEFNKSNFAASDTGKITSNGLNWFEYTIYDSTEGCATWDGTARGTTGRLFATMRIALNVDYFDETKPTVKIKPFFWKSRAAKDNSIAWNSDGNPLGHIELEGDLTQAIIDATNGTTALGDDDPKVSGKIVVRGTAEDNIRLSKIYAKFESHSALDTYQLIGEYSNGTWGDAKTGTGWSCITIDTYAGNDGHRAEWELTIDTSLIENVADIDKAITVFAVDERGTTTSSESGTSLTGNSSFSEIGTTQTTTNSETAYYKVDVVPYITGISTSSDSLKAGNTSVYNRTAKGKYPVLSNETVTVSGFNLGTATTKDISEITTSGAFAVTVNNITSLNNVNDNNAKGAYSGVLASTKAKIGDKEIYQNWYNRQPNGDNNENLTDDVYFDIYHIKKGAYPVRGTLTEPIMRVNPVNDMLGFAFTNGPDLFSMPTGVDAKTFTHNYDNANHSATTTAKSYYRWQYNYADFNAISFVFDANGHAHATSAGLDTEPSTNYAGKFSYSYSGWGPGRIAMSDTSANQYKEDNYIGMTSNRIESVGVPARTYVGGTQISNAIIDTHRIRRPSIVTSVHQNNTSIYLAYYDDIQQQIRFRHGNLANDSSIKKNFGDYVDKGGNAAWEAGDSDFSLIAGKEGNNTNSTGQTAGEYLAIDVWPEKGEKTPIYNYTLKDGIDVLEGEYHLTTYDNPKRFYYISDDSLTYQNKEVYILDANKKLLGEAKLGSTQTSGFYTGKFYIVESENMEDEQGTNVKYVVLKSNAPFNTSFTSEFVKEYNEDVVVAVWYNGNDLKYAYTDNPSNEINLGCTGSSWKGVKTIFTNGGEHCAIKVDEKGGVHIAAYDTNKADLKYAYLSSPSANYNEATDAVTVDAYAIVGTEIMIDTYVTSENGTEQAVPTISYYMPSIQKVKIATPVIPASGAITRTLNGADPTTEKYTGDWEISVIPTNSKVQSDHTSIGYWKTSTGTLKTNITTGTDSVTLGGNDGVCYGNGTTNPAIAYAVKENTTGAIEVAQKK